MTVANLDALLKRYGHPKWRNRASIGLAAESLRHLLVRRVVVDNFYSHLNLGRLDVDKAVRLR